MTELISNLADYSYLMILTFFNKTERMSSSYLGGKRSKWCIETTNKFTT